VRKLWCTGVIASGVVLFGAAPAWADDTPTAAVIRTVPFAGLPMQVAGVAQIMPDDGALPAVPVPGMPALDDPAPGTPADPSAPHDPFTVEGPAFPGDPGVSPDLSTPEDPFTSQDPSTSEDPGTSPDTDAPGAPKAPAAAPTVAPTAGTASVSAPPPADDPDTAAPTPSAAGPAASGAPVAFAAAQRRKAPTLPAVDDPRLLEEPVDGFVNREKWKR
jgi:hypothetical protein